MLVEEFDSLTLKDEDEEELDKTFSGGFGCPDEIAGLEFVESVCFKDKIWPFERFKVVAVKDGIFTTFIAELSCDF